MTATIQRQLSRREAAEYAGVHYNTVRLWERTGRLAVHRAPNGDVLIDREELEALMNERNSGGGRNDHERTIELEAENKMLREQLADARAAAQRWEEEARRQTDRYTEVLERIALAARGKGQE